MRNVYTHSSPSRTDISDGEGASNTDEKYAKRKSVDVSTPSGVAPPDALKQKIGNRFSRTVEGSRARSSGKNRDSPVHRLYRDRAS